MPAVAAAINNEYGPTESVRMPRNTSSPPGRRLDGCGSVRLVLAAWESGTTSEKDGTTPAREVITTMRASVAARCAGSMRGPRVVLSLRGFIGAHLSCTAWDARQPDGTAWRGIRAAAAYTALNHEGVFCSCPVSFACMR